MIKISIQFDLAMRPVIAIEADTPIVPEVLRIIPENDSQPIQTDKSKHKKAAIIKVCSGCKTDYNASGPAQNLCPDCKKKA